MPPPRPLRGPTPSNSSSPDRSPRPGAKCAPDRPSFSLMRLEQRRTPMSFYLRLEDRDLRNLTPAPPPFSSINSIPAASIAFRSFARASSDTFGPARISSSSLRSPASSADAAPRTRITCGSCNRAPWGVGSATSLRSLYAAPIIARSIGEATRWPGGCRWILNRSMSRKGYGTRPAFTVPPRMETWTYRPVRQPFNRRKMTVSDRPWDRPTNDIVETI
jgi:hypothetical protein